MLDTPEVKKIYSKMQKQLFNMIPEKWEKVYLYASITNQNNLQAGEMFFYYIPKSIIKKKPVNVYDIPAKFNIEEDVYMQLVDNLYDSIRKLQLEFEKNNEKLWSNITLCIENTKFKVIFNNDNLVTSKYSSNDRHIIWKYKYLEFPIEKFNKNERKILEEYLNEEHEEDEVYTDNVYEKNVSNIIDYNTNIDSND